MDESRYKQLLPQFRAKTNEAVWFSMHSAPSMPEYKLAGELVLSEREQTAVQLRAKLAYRQSWAGIGIAMTALVISLLTFVRGCSTTQSTGIQPQSKSQPPAASYTPAPSSLTPAPKSSGSATPTGTTSPATPAPKIQP